MKVVAILIAAVILIGCLSSGTSNTKEDQGGIRVHGTSCGPGTPSYEGRNSPQPVSHLDKACQEHDRCYAENGYFNCGCDYKFVRDIRKDAIEGPEIASAIFLYFAFAPCVDPNPLAVALTMFSKGMTGMGGAIVIGLTSPVRLLHIIFEPSKKPS
jgi:hypothetical protein